VTADPGPRPTSRGGPPLTALLVVSAALFAASMATYSAAGAAAAAKGADPGALRLWIFRDPDHYFSHIRQYADGRWLSEQMMCAEPNARAYVNFAWLLLGKLMGALSLSQIEVVHVWRALALFTMVPGAFLVAREIGLRPRRAAAVAALFAFGGGLTWHAHLVAPGPAWNMGPTELDVPYQGLFMWLVTPHPGFAQGLMLVGCGFALRASRVRSAGLMWTAGIVVAAFAWTRTYDAVLGLLVVAFALRRGGFAARHWLVLAPTIGVMAYYQLLFRLHPVFAWWYRQSDVRAPAVATTVIAAGVCAVVPLLYVGVWIRRARADPVFAVLLAWFLGAWALFHSYPLVRWAGMYVSSVAAPSWMLTGYLVFGDGGLFDRVASRWSRAAAGAAFAVAAAALCLPSSVRTWRKYDGILRDPKTYVSQDLMAAYRWIDANTPADGAVVAPEGASLGTPRWAGRHVYGGYLSATPDYRVKAAVLRTIFDPAADAAERTRLLRATGARWVLVDPDDPVSPGGAVAGIDGLSKRFASGRVAVYESAGR